MREKVKVDGIELTRKQVEEAYKRINEPEPFKPGDLVKQNFSYTALGDFDRRFLVVDPIHLKAIASGMERTPSGTVLLGTKSHRL